MECEKTNPYRGHYAQKRYGVPMAQWPPTILQGWQRYCVSRALEIKEKTRVGYEGWFACYVGYNLNVESTPIEFWDQLFEPERLLRFIGWHAKRVGGIDARASQLGRHVLDFMAMLAEQEDRSETLALRKMQRKLPKPSPMHQTKRPEHTFTLQELDAVGLAYIEAGKQPLLPMPPSGWARIKHPGLVRSLKYQTGLLIRLWIRVPMRSRSIREMDLDGRLFRDAQGRWQLLYIGDQLKIDEASGETNEFRIPWPPELIENLETYLREHRPRFPEADMHQELFLSEQGNPFSQGVAWERFHLAIYQALHKRIWPHLLRKIWSDAYLDNHPGDYEGAAAMLNNTPAMVQRTYRRFRREQHLQKAIDFNAEVFSNGHPKRKTP